MTRAELRSLRPGDRVRLSLSRPRGAALYGTVTAARAGGTGRHYVLVEWDDYAADDYRRYARFSADWASDTGVLRLRRERP